jgi:Spy/CpxP family protein refolding chaperone
MLDMVSNRRFSRISITLLVLLNLGLISSMVWHERMIKEQPPPRDDLEVFLGSELALSPSQVEQMRHIRREHFQTAGAFARSLQDSSQELLFLAFQADPDSSRAAALSQHMGEIHSQLEWALYDHFVKLAQICTPAQRVLLLDLTQELTQGKRPGGPGQPRHPGQAVPRRPPDGKEQGGPPSRGR